MVLICVVVPSETENGDVRVWVVERGCNNGDVIILKYATPEGDRVFRREPAAQVVNMDTVTADKDISPDDLDSWESVESVNESTNQTTTVSADSQKSRLPDD